MHEPRRYLLLLVLLTGILGCDSKEKSNNSSGSGLPLPTPTSDGVVAYGEGRLYWIGGALRGVGPTDRVHSVGVADGQWSDHEPADTKGLHMGFAHDGGSTYIAGGMLNADMRGVSHSDDVHRFNGADSSWSRLPSLPEKREAPALVMYDGALHAFGGAGEDYQTHADSWVLAKGGASWAPLPAMPTTRSLAGAAVVEGKIYVFGGEHDDGDPEALARRVSVVEIFDPATASWSEADSMPKRRHAPYHASLAGTLYVFPAHTVMDGDAVLTFSPEGGWSKGPDLPREMGTLVEGAVVEGERILLLTRSLGKREKGEPIGSAKDTIHVLVFHPEKGFTLLHSKLAP